MFHLRDQLADFERHLQWVEKRGAKNDHHRHIGQYAMALQLVCSGYPPPPPDGAGAAIIDVGCGPGHFLRYLATLGYTNLHGVDLERQAAWNGVGSVAFVQGDARDLIGLYPTQRFDVVTALNLFHHEHGFVDIVAQHAWSEAVLRSLAVVLKPGGNLLINREFELPQGATEAAGLRLWRRWGHFELFSDTNAATDGDAASPRQSLLTDHPAYSFIEPIIAGKPVLSRFELCGVHDGQSISFIFRDMLADAPFSFSLVPVGESPLCSAAFDLALRCDRRADLPRILLLKNTLKELIARNARRRGDATFGEVFRYLPMAVSEFRLAEFCAVPWRSNR